MTTSFEICKWLHDKGWLNFETEKEWIIPDVAPDSPFLGRTDKTSIGEGRFPRIPAPSLGEWVRKLPDVVRADNGDYYFILEPLSGHWCAVYQLGYCVEVLGNSMREPDFPEDACALMWEYLNEKGLVKP